MELILLCLIIACIVGILICLIAYALIKDPTQEDFEKLRKSLTKWYLGLSDEERKQVNDKGIYGGWNREK
jgi:hypothetical protein